MAIAGANDYDLECAICTEILRDTRMLQCGHYFCKLCLETIAEDHPQGSVTCCKCGHVTDTNGKAGVDKLRKLTYITELADKRRVETIKQSLIDQKDKAPDTEVVDFEKDIVQNNTGAYRHVVSNYTVKEDSRRNKLIHPNAMNISKITTFLDKQSDRGPLTVPLKQMLKFNVGDNTYGLAVDSVRERLVVRRKDTTAPITVYDFQGQQLQVLGKDVEGIASTDRQGVAIDTKRKLYILPMEDGSLVTMDANGIVQDRIKVMDETLHGICYSDQDMYITSSVNTDMVYMVNPNTKQICKDFCPTTTCTFSFPYNVSSGQYDPGDGTKPVIFVSDCFNHCIKVLDYSGNLLHTYGKEGKGDEELYLPEGVCVGPDCRVIVCDINNNRVVAFYSEEDKDGWEVLLDNDKLRGQGLYYVACDPRNRKLFIVCKLRDIIIFEG